MKGWYFLISLTVVLVVIAYAVWPILRQFLTNTVSFFLMGWLVGGNWMLRWWGNSVDKVAFKQDAPLTLVSGALTGTDWVDVLLVSPWFLSTLLIIVGCGVLIRQIDQLRSRAFLFVTMTGVSLMLLVVWNVIGIDMNFSAHAYSSRYYLFAVPAVVLAFTALIQHSKKRSQIIAGIFLVACSVGSLAMLKATMTPVIKEAHALETLVENYLKEDSGNYIVCARTDLPEICSVLYGYNNYRSASSIARLNKMDAYNGHVLYSTECFTTSWWEFIHCTRLVNRARRIMVIFEYVPAEGYALFTDLLWTGQHSKMAAGMVRLNCTGQPIGRLCTKR